MQRPSGFLGVDLSAARGVDRSLTADLVVNRAGLGGAFGGGRLSPRLADDIATVPAVRAAVGLGAGSALVDGVSEPLGIPFRAEGDLPAGAKPSSREARHCLLTPKSGERRKP